MKDHLIQPHGGTLVNLLVGSDNAIKIKKLSKNWVSWDLTERQILDLELLITGAFSPLTGFMRKKEYESVCSTMHLKEGILWPMPIVLDVPEALIKQIKVGEKIALRDPEGVLIAALDVDDIWRPDKLIEAKTVYGTTSKEHPGVVYLLDKTNPWYVGGNIEAVQLPEHYDFLSLRLDPAELRANFTRLGWRKVIAFQTRNPMHRAQYEITLNAAKEVEANLLLHPVVGLTKPEDIDHYTRVRCYQALLGYYPKNKVMLSLLSLAMRFAGPREALLHAIISKNFGCTHLITGKDHADPGNDKTGDSYYSYDTIQEFLDKYKNELEVNILPIREMVYIEDMDTYIPDDEVPEGKRILSISESELRQRLAEGSDIPPWFTFPEVAQELRKTHPPRYKQGFTVFFTGLSGAGKSTMAKALLARFLETSGRPVTLLDGDIVRKNLSSELGFSKDHRDINIRRIGFVASEITKNGGIALCAPIAPYDKIRKEVRDMITPLGGFILVYVSTPLEVCESRDRKGMYAKARAGIIKEFTGISDPYETPEDAEVIIDTTDMTPEEAVQQIILHLEREGYIGGQ